MKRIQIKKNDVNQVFENHDFVQFKNIDIDLIRNNKLV